MGGWLKPFKRSVSFWLLRKVLGAYFYGYILAMRTEKSLPGTQKFKYVVRSLRIYKNAKGQAGLVHP